MAFIVGLTGGIGSGKSSVARLFERRGVTVIDADAIAHALTAPNGVAMAAIRAAFGDDYVDHRGAMDRARMRALAFSDREAKRKLESILHPLISAETKRQLEAAKSEYVILMVPLLVESGAPRRRCHRVLVVDVPEEAQVARVIARDSLSAETTKAIMANQASRETRIAAADDVIDNSGAESDLDAQVSVLHERYLALARSREWSSPPSDPDGSPQDRGVR